MHSGSGRIFAVKQNSAVAVYVGIASLVLEGRALGGEDDDENFLRSQSPHLHHHHLHRVANEELDVTNASTSSVAVSNVAASRNNNGVGVIHRISEKLMSLRQFPGTSREVDIVEASIAIPCNDDQYERQPRLHHVASAREFQRNPRLTSIPASSTPNSSAAASVLHDIDVDWNDISILLNGLDPIVNVPSFPLKLSSPSPTTHHLAYRSSHSMSINQDSRMKLVTNKPQARITEKTMTCGSPSSSTVTAATKQPKQGPHCEKFLKKLGLLKFDSPDMEIDHMCNHVNSYCRRWQLHLKKLLQVLSKAEDACIEVYLGPENNAILLEQWIITLSDKPSSATMTIQALCSAIRSQLCFSQISSWIDLLKKAFIDGDESFKEQMPSLFTSEIMQNPRLKKNLQTMQVNLDILFRVKSYDGTSCFNEKPNVHNFPDTIISDGLAICVCLKSLPRLEKIPTLNTEKAHLNGFSFANDNRMKPPSNIAEAPLVACSSHILHDRFGLSCHEKGKHRCKEEVDDDYEEIHHNPIDSVPNASSLSLSSSENASLTSTLSHRERQLLKYKKRLLKRDKQKKKQLECEQQHQSIFKTNPSHTSESSAPRGIENNGIDVTDNINSMEIPLYHSTAASQQQIPTFFKDKRNVNNDNDSDGDEEDDDEKEVEKDSTAISIITASNVNKKSIVENDNKNTITTTKTLSIATQTEELVAMPKCDNCGNQLQCFNCDKIKKNLTKSNINSKNNFNNQIASPLAIMITSSSTSSPISTVSGTMVGSKANLLLQAIQRTANSHNNPQYHQQQQQHEDEDILCDNKNIFSSSKIQKTTPRDKLLSSSTAINHNMNTMSDDCDRLINVNINNNNNNNNSSINNNNNNNNDNSVEISSKEIVGDCRLCKRQKTKHNYTPFSFNGSNGDAGSINGNSYRRTMSETMVGSPENSEDHEESENATLSPLSIHNCDDLQVNSCNNMEDLLSYGDLKAYRRAFSEDVINQLPDDDYDEDDVITIKCHHSIKANESSTHAHKLTPNVSLLNRDYSISNESSNDISRSNQQRIPKINLTQIFDTIESQKQQHQVNDSGIIHDESFSPTSDNVFIFNSPVKSYPPTVMQLSPGSLIKRRTRHISDRSSISEYCSDEDDSVIGKCTVGMPTTKISSLYKKFVSKTQTAFNKFSKLPLVGNIEENLLHNRFQPKAVVDGFKLLLGASGSFCPTQLTIPAQTYFYEFQGIKHMSTPYVCEFRLTRKYSIPRSGTVQATLLNPQGTVVRMFFVPYDFRDMPAMSQTFIRQRVLAIDDHFSQKNKNNVEQMSTSEQMKHLRYVINLRFQTGRSGRLFLHTDIKLIISRRTEFDTAAAHAKNSLESPNDLKTVIICPENPKFSSRIDRN